MEHYDVDVCDVCRILDGDVRLKVVEYCPKCKANICESCKPKMLRRAHAMAKRSFLSFFGVKV